MLIHASLKIQVFVGGRAHKQEMSKCASHRGGRYNTFTAVRRESDCITGAQMWCVDVYARDCFRNDHPIEGGALPLYTTACIRVATHIAVERVDSQAR